MDWIERYLHFDPDGGNGSVEWAILAFVVLLLVVGASRLVRALVRAQANRGAAPRAAEARACLGPHVRGGNPS